MNKDRNIFKHGRPVQKPDYNLSEPESLHTANKNKKELTPQNVLNRHRSERLIRLVTNSLGLRMRIDNIDELEVFCNIYEGKKYICSLHKTWDSPVFHIQDEIKINRRDGSFKERFRKIHEICSLHQVVMLFPPVKSYPDLEAVLQMGICEYGFNDDVLEWALVVFEKCRKKIKAFLRSK